MLDLTCDLKFAPLPTCVRGEAHVLGGDPKGKRILYTNGHNVFIRELHNPKNVELYSEHAAPATVAKFSPSGNFICSGDIQGKIKIWELLPDEFKLKSEFPIFAGKIKDISWDGEGKRIGICGFGREYKAKVIMWDSGNNLGELSNIGKCGNSIAFKKTRPFRCVVAAEDKTSIFYSGPPFKYTTTEQDHSGFVNCATFSPDGSVFVTCSSDKTILMYDGKDGTFIGNFVDGKFAHDGGVYSVCFNADGSELLSAGGDKKCKIWNVKDRTCILTFVLGTGFPDMALSCLWQGDDLVVLTLNGHIRFLDRENPDQPKRTIKGHVRAIWGVAVNPKDRNILYSGDVEGKIVQWNISEGEATYFKGAGHGDDIKVSAVEYDTASDKIVSIGNDDNIRFTCPSSLEYGESIALGSQPIGITLLSDGFIAVLCAKELVIIKNGQKVSTHNFGDEDEGTDYDPSYISGHGSTIVIPLKKEGFAMYKLTPSGDLEKLEEVKTIVSAGPFAFSEDGSMLAAVQGNNTIRVYTLANGMEKYSEIIGHSGRIVKVSFSPNGNYLASTGNDNYIIVADVSNPKNKAKITLCHNKSRANNLTWVDNGTVATVGNDAVIKFWNVVTE